MKRTQLGILSFLLLAAPAWAGLTATLVDTPFSTSSAGIGQYDLASVTVFIDPSVTNWIAWNDTPTVSRTDASFPGQFFLWGGGGFGTDDFIVLTVTNPGGTSLAVNMDLNDAFGAHLVPSNKMNVIFGTAAAAPNALRIDAFGSTAGTRRVFNEAGGHNSVFTTAGNYTFQFSFRNQFGSAAGHSNVYLLVDSNPNDESGVPEPATWLGGLAGVSLVWARRRALP